MKKLILSVFMFALIAGASVNSPANASVSPTSGIVATPHLIYCLTSSDVKGESTAVVGTVAGGWAFKAGYGLAATLGCTVGGLVVGLAIGL